MGKRLLRKGRHCMARALIRVAPTLHGLGAVGLERRAVDLACRLLLRGAA